MQSVSCQCAHTVAMSGWKFICHNNYFSFWKDHETTISYTYIIETEWIPSPVARIFRKGECLWCACMCDCMHEQSTNHISLMKQAKMLCKVTHCEGCVLANNRPHQLRWVDRKMGTAISCTECSQVAGLIQKSVEAPRKHRLFVQLSFVQRYCVAIMHTHARLGHVSTEN